MEKLGLVLAGGGGKGAYEIGVWQALRDLGLEQSVAAVSGTSQPSLPRGIWSVPGPCGGTCPPPTSSSPPTRTKRRPRLPSFCPHQGWGSALKIFFTEAASLIP